MSQPQIRRQYRWKVQARLPALAFLTVHGLKLAAERFGLDRRMVGEWRNRAEADGIVGSVPRYPAPRQNRIRATTVTLIEQARRRRREVRGSSARHGTPSPRRIASCQRPSKQSHQGHPLKGYDLFTVR